MSLLPVFLAAAPLVGPAVLVLAGLLVGVAFWRSPRTAPPRVPAADPGAAAHASRQRAMQAEARAALRVPFNRPAVRL